MRTQGAAPEGRDLRAAGSSGDTLAGERSISRVGLPPHIAERLAAEGVHSLEDWCALGRRRLTIWGVTRRIVTELDALARERRS